MEKIRLGSQMLELCSFAKQELWLVAPFIKKVTLAQLLNQVNDGVFIKCVSRWRPEEIVVGATDIEVRLLLKQQLKSTLLLKDDLHAKYYRSDEWCLIGSANLTQSASGWSNAPHLELLFLVLAQESILQSLEQELIQGCITVNDSVDEQVKLSVEAVRNEISKFNPIKAMLPNGELSPINITTRLPKLLILEYPYFAYVGEKDKLTSASRESAQSDLAVLQVLSSFAERAFNAYVSSVLIQMPIIQQIDEIAKQPQRFGAVTQFLASLPCAITPDFDVKHTWQTLMRWLCYFSLIVVSCRSSTIQKYSIEWISRVRI